MRKALVIGGPKHGQRMRVDGSALYGVRIPEPLPRNYSFGVEPEAFCAPAYSAVTYRTEKYALSPTRTVILLVHPDIHTETACRYAADLIFAAWEKAGND